MHLNEKEILISQISSESNPLSGQKINLTKILRLVIRP